MDRSSDRKLIRKINESLNDTLDQLDLIGIYMTFHPKAANYTFFSSAHRTFSRIDHILGHKSNLCKFRKTEIISSIFSDHNGMRLEIRTSLVIELLRVYLPKQGTWVRSLVQEDFTCCGEMSPYATTTEVHAL